MHLPLNNLKLIYVLTLSHLLEKLDYVRRRLKLTEDDTKLAEDVIIINILLFSSAGEKKIECQ